MTLTEFLEDYAQSGVSRFHMPGHKGRSITGAESCDITEIKGADYLYEAEGLIAQSEKRMSALYGTAGTIYSTEGSSLCIKTMLGAVRSVRGNLKVLAARNCHKAFIDACGLLDAEVRWLYPGTPSRSICSSFITADDVSKALDKESFDCIYLTSPDYLGFMADIKAVSQVCRAHGVLLLVDNAHGAYLRFTSEDLHPMTLGADICCDSTHKTLPCLTGTAMLHFSERCEKELSDCAKAVMSVFGSTSPSYLLMKSLDKCSLMLSEGDLKERIRAAAERTRLCRERLEALGFTLVGDEKMKLTVDASRSGLSGTELGDLLREHGIEPEYCDPVYTVLMPSSETPENDFQKLESAMSEIRQGAPKESAMPPVSACERVMSIREAMFSKSESVPVEDSEGRVCARTVTGCQPSVPIAVSGERISKETVRLLLAYGINKICVVSQEGEII